MNGDCNCHCHETECYGLIEVKAKMPECVPAQAHDGEWFDLAVSEDYQLAPGQTAYLDLGVCIKLPDGYEAIVAPRSSTFKRYHIIQTNGIGVIDAKYCGDDDWWKMPVHAVDSTIIRAGTRVAQFRLQKVQPRFEVKVVDKLNNTNRGGLGSTGV